MRFKTFFGVVGTFTYHRKFKRFKSRFKPFCIFSLDADCDCHAQHKLKKDRKHLTVKIDYEIMITSSPINRRYKIQDKSRESKNGI